MYEIQVRYSPISMEYFTAKNIDCMANMKAIYQVLQNAFPAKEGYKLIVYFCRNERELVDMSGQ